MFTFDETLATNLDVMRSLLGDTVALTAMRSDEAIYAALAWTSSAARPIDRAFVFLVTGLVNELRMRPKSFSESGGVSISWDRVGPLTEMMKLVMSGSWSYEATAGTIGSLSRWGAVVDLTADIYEPARVFAP